jgi:hypothetical protein
MAKKFEGASFACRSVSAGQFKVRLDSFSFIYDSLYGQGKIRRAFLVVFKENSKVRVR